MDALPDQTALTVALAGWDEHLPVRRRLDHATAAGFAAVQLDARAPDVRPRALHRSARRDLAATLRRAGLRLAGIDLWIPPQHFSRPDASDRALAAAEGAIDLAADLATLTSHPASAIVSLILPPDAGAGADALAHAAAGRGVRLADHGWPRPALAAASTSLDEGEPLALGLDPAVLLISGADPVRQAAADGSRLASARLADADQATRVPVGAGRLDVAAYRAALSVAAPAAPVVVDLRGVRNPIEALTAARRAWGVSAAPG